MHPVPVWQVELHHALQAVCQPGVILMALAVGVLGASILNGSPFFKRVYLAIARRIPLVWEEIQRRRMERQIRRIDRDLKP